MKKILLAGVMAVGLSAMPAVAAPFVGTIPMKATNEVLPPLKIVEGWYGSQIYLFGGPATVTVTLIGWEAGAKNEFIWNGTSIMTAGQGGTGDNREGNLGSPITQAQYDTLPWGNPMAQAVVQAFAGVTDGLVNFAFGSSIANGDVANGANVNPGLNRGNFFVSFTDTDDFNDLDQVKGDGTASGGRVAWIWFDDLGAGPDDNHDDMVVRLSLNGGSFQVPEPATLGLLGAGLLGLGFAARRRRKA